MMWNVSVRLKKGYRFLLIALILLICLPAAVIAGDLTKTTKENVMRLAYETDTVSPSVPPIDNAVIVDFKTASFGLG